VNTTSKLLGLGLLVSVVTSCGTCGTSTPQPEIKDVAIGGAVFGLVGKGLVLESGGVQLPITADGAFAFEKKVTTGGAWEVTIVTQPKDPLQTCKVEGGSGTAGTVDVTSVHVQCVNDTFTLGGTVTGLNGKGLFLRTAAGDRLPITADGAFTFGSRVETGSSYAVTIEAQPRTPTQVCTVSGGTGTVVAGNITSVAVNCKTGAFALGGTVRGLAGTVVLQNNGGGDLTLNANGSFAFATPLDTGAAYAVTVKTQPTSPSQTCVLGNATGTMGTAEVTSLTLDCTTNRYAIGGTVTGLLGQGLLLQLNGGADQAVLAPGPFTFAAPIASGTAWTVTVKDQPTGPKQTCAITGGTGVVGGAAVSTVAIACVTDRFNVKVNVSGLAGAGLVLRNNGGDDLTVAASGVATFATKVSSGAAYDVTVQAQPSAPTQTCVVGNGAGNVIGADITSVTVTCTTNRYTISGTVTGVYGSGLVLQNNGGDAQAISGNGAFSFPVKVASGSPWLVTVSAQPGSPSQTCTVAGGTGTVVAADVGSVVVNCTTNRYTVGGTATGVAASATLQLNNGDDLVVSANGSFAFATPLLSSATYAVTVRTQPTSPWQTCVLGNGSGTVTSAAITNLTLTCTTNRYTVGGSVTGLVGGGLVLQDNLGDDLAITATGAFTFATQVASGAHYAVTVKTQPTTPWQTCAVTTGSGTMAGANLTNVAVACTTNTYTIGGTVTGLTGSGLVLQDNGGNDLSVTAAGVFTFPTALNSGATYAVTVKTQPTTPWQTCTVNTGSGTVAGANVTTVDVACTTNTYTVGGAVTGLTGSGLVLQDNAGDDLAITGNGPFTFATSVASNQAWAVTVKTQPSTPTQTCLVTQDSGTMAGAAVTTVSVACATNAYAIGGTVTGLVGTGLTLRNNGGDDLLVSANGAFTFATPVSSGQSYAVTVQQEPTAPWQTCTVTTGSGGVVASAITSVSVSCATNTYQVGGTVSGLLGSGLQLQDNAGDDLSVNADGAFTFATSVASGAAYAVTVLTQPTAPSQTCVVTQDTGSVAGAHVTAPTVTCTTNNYSVGGTVSGLTGLGLELQDNLGDDLSIAADGSFTFATHVASSANYSVTVKTQPTVPWQTCVVANGSGSIVAAGVTNVAVTCTTNTYTIGGTVTGLAGAGLVLTNNGGDDLAVSATGAFSFPLPIASNAGFSVALKTQPTAPWQTCSVTSGAGTVGGAQVTSVVVNCVTDTHAVGGTVRGLAGSGLVLEDNVGDPLPIAADGSFTFATNVASGATYAVTVKTQPTTPWQTCLVANGSGTVAGGAVSNVAVTCSTNTYAIGGTVSGLIGTGLVLEDAGDPLTLSADGSFTFATPIASNAMYAVKVKTQPTSPWQTCSVTSGSGTVAGAAVTSVSVSCVTDTSAIGGMVSGLSGTGLVLQDNGDNDLSVSANGRFAFPTHIASGATYAVTVKTQPTLPWETCLVTNGTGTVAGASVNNVSVTCSINSYAVGGSVSGLSGTGLVLRDNGGDDLNVSANGSFTFATHVASAATYAVTVATQPSAPSQTCSVTSDSGTVAGAAITGVSVTCVNNNYTVGGTVSGLTGAGLVLRNNGGDNKSLSANGAFTFASTVPAGSSYAVTVLTQPLGQTCVVGSGSGTSSGANVTNVSITCTANPYTVGGMVTGLSGTGLVVTNNGVDDKALSANAPYVFPSTMSTGQAYVVAVKTQPTSPSQTCLVSNPSGNMPAGNVSNASISCSTNTYSVGGNVTGLAGSGLVLLDNGGNNLAVPASGSFTFSANVASGANYAVTVGTQPTTPWQTCSVTNGSGTIVAGAVADVAVACTTNIYNVSATVVGLTGTGLVIQNNGGQDKAIASNSTVSFTTQLSGSAYNITVLTQPTGPVQTCMVANGTGTVAGADISATIVCAPKSCNELHVISPSSPSGIYWIDPDGAGAQAAFEAYCDMTTDTGGWTLLTWNGNTASTPAGVPYPGNAYCSGLNCARGSGVPSGQMNSLLSVSTEFAQGASLTNLKATYALINSYEYAGKYHYGALTGMTMNYGANACSATNSKTGTYTSIVNGGPNATIYLDQHLSTCLGSFPDYNDTNAYLWVVGEVNAPCSCTGTPPGSYMGTWSSGQYGSSVLGSPGSFSVWIR
jgi:hypothetical protein